MEFLPEISTEKKYGSRKISALFRGIQTEKKREREREKEREREREREIERSIELEMTVILRRARAVTVKD